MDNQTLYEKRGKKWFIIFLVLFLALIVVISIIYYTSTSRSPEPEGDYLEIQNIDEETRGKPKNAQTLNYIKSALFTTVNMNNDPPVEPDSVDDIYIREGTFSQEYNDATSVHTVTFYVDIESLQQSYDVMYQWSDSGSIDNIDPYGTLVKCLPVDQLRYGDFDCIDSLIEESLIGGDRKISSILPHYDNLFVIRAYFDGDDVDQVVISVQIMSTNTSDETSRRFNTYKNQANKWLEDQGVVLGEYRIEYRDFSNIVVDVSQQTIGND